MLFRPTVALHSILEVTPQLLMAMGIKGLILDLDNTLTTHDNPKPADGVLDWIKLMKKSKIKLMILSNNTAARVTPFADMLGLHFVPDGAKPLSKGYRQAIKELRLPKSAVCGIGDQLFTDILGANLTGIKSIFVYPIEPEKSTFFKIKRTIEKPLLPKKYGHLNK